MQLAEKKQSFLEKGKDIQKKVEYNQFLKRLISAYSSPFIEPLYDYSELITSRKEQAILELDDRFTSDRLALIGKLIPLLPEEEKLKSFEKFCKKNHSDSSELEQRLFKIFRLLSENLYPDSKDWVHSILYKLTEEEVRAASSKDSTQQLTDILEIVLDQVIDKSIIPRMFELDHIDDIINIIKSRYAGNLDKHWDRSNLILNVLKVATTGDTTISDDELIKIIQKQLGENHKYKPKYGNAHPDIKKVIPDLFDELVSIKAKDNLSRFLQINKEYSFRQRQYHKAKSKGNPWGLPLIAGLEEDHHLMLRSLIKLKNQGKLTKDDEVLVVGPRYVDELAFFRKHLGFAKTTGLDLFDDEDEGIVAGDMHATNFADGQFGLIFCAGTLAYAYDIRKVLKEFTRILKRPGFLCLMDAGDRVNGVDPLGRSDPMGLEALLSCLYERQIIVHAQDRGRTPLPSMFKWWPCVVMEVLD